MLIVMDLIICYDCHGVWTREANLDTEFCCQCFFSWGLHQATIVVSQQSSQSPLDSNIRLSGHYPFGGSSYIDNIWKNMVAFLISFFKITTSKVKMHVILYVLAFMSWYHLHLVFDILSLWIEAALYHI